MVFSISFLNCFTVVWREREGGRRERERERESAYVRVSRGGHVTEARGHVATRARKKKQITRFETSSRATLQDTTQRTNIPRQGGQAPSPVHPMSSL